MRRAMTWLPWILLIIVVTGFFIWQKSTQPAPKPVSDHLAVEKQKPLLSTAPQGGVVSYNQAVRVAAPAVVNIFTTQKVIVHPQIEDPVLRKFFERQFPQESKDNETSLGSGVVVSKNGFILTNNHVVAQADQIVVALQDGRRATAKLIGTDPDTDLAVIKIELDNLTVLPFKNSPSEVGDVVLAIGNPFGVGQTVTQGIISATGRSGLGINTYEDFIQTDAAINPGNSGGALIDVSGNLVGINTAIFSRTGGSLGIGFAIPAKLAQQVWQSILQDGKVTRGWLGIEVKGIDPTEFPAATAPDNGVQVMGVLANGPAAQGGLKKGDIIVAIDGQQMLSATQLIKWVAQQKPDTQVNMLVKRGNENLNLAITIAERPNQKSTPIMELPGWIE
ncbi:S1C family serine protease [Alkanindiges sp. WGS2144]|uniref:S1C family serine protease n=1 Tax=Alkanindiges sp. WGS2144 TaxID=3366808 RepID=UPI0037539BAE